MIGVGKDNPIASGLEKVFQPTIDAAQQDWEDIRSGRVPRQAVKAAGQGLMAFNNPSLGTAIPPVPKYFQYSANQIKDIDDYIDLARKFGNPADDMLELRKVIEQTGGLKQAGYAQPLEVLLDSLGQRGKWASDVLKSYDIARSKVGKRPDVDTEIALEQLYKAIRKK